MDVSEYVALDPEAVRITATVHGGYALALEKLEVDVDERSRFSSDVAMVHASSLLRAASYHAIVDQEGARQIFRRAAVAYANLHRPYAVILAICSGSQGFAGDVARRMQGFDGTDPTEPIVHLLIRNLLDVKVGEWRRPQPATPVGRLRLPFGSYQALLSSASQSLDAIGNYLARVIEAPMAASTDRYHWRRHFRAILPVEPEIVAPLIGLVWQGWLRIRPHHLEVPMARAVAEVAIGLARTRNEGERSR